MIDITVRKLDVKIKTNETDDWLVDITVIPAGEREKGKDAQTVTFTLELNTAARLHEALEAYGKLNDDMYM